ncbi:GNAT family N-acetyltransferase [Lysinibacillus parviboronicapiens]|uniref:GNAT family N-acetyltransferase n=1 Tax=Lysinibacillus parviboronicapiens TaxID=436516 RepID=UPI000D3C1DE0|nr:GNAT family N-acetyltransferase [Lysinibacillus parviboronicapiens]
MQLFVREMDNRWATELLHWTYSAPYDFYNNELTTETLKEILDNSYQAIVNDKEQLIGYFCTGISAQVPSGHEVDAYLENGIDIGIGLKPDLTGKGFGTEFFSFIVSHVRQTTHAPLRLTVAKFNTRAIHLYEKLGFKKKLEFKHQAIRFITMLKE